MRPRLLLRAHILLMYLLWNKLKLVSLFLQPFYTAGQSAPKLVGRAQRVVESDYAARAGIALYILIYFIGIEALAVVARHEIPHHEFVVTLKEMVLQMAQPPMRRAKEIGVEQLVSLVNIFHIGSGSSSKTTKMIESMVAYTMACGLHHLKLCRVFPHIVAHHEERSLYSVMVKEIQHAGRDVWYRTVVESKIDSPLLRLYPPESIRIDNAQEPRRLLYNHISVIQVHQVLKSPAALLPQ